MKVFYSTEVIKFIEDLGSKDNARLTRTRKFFEENGFLIGNKYIKKISKAGVWELRSGKVRLFLCIGQSRAFAVHAIYKKSQKLPRNDIKLAEKRCNDL